MIDTILNNKKLFVAGWIAGAFFILAYNITFLKKMLTAPRVPTPGVVMTAMQRSDQLKTMDTEFSEKSQYLLKLNMFISNFEKWKLKERMHTRIDKTQQQDTQQVEEVHLPKLTGILRIMDINGKPQNFAVFGGQKHREKDDVQGFIIYRITRDGVTLKKAGKRWFLNVPKINYSLESVQ